MAIYSKNEKTLSENADEKESIYYRTVNYQRDILRQRAQAKVDEGVYNTLEEAMADIKFPSLLSAVKNIVMKHNASSSPTIIKEEAMNYIVTQIMDLTPEQFWAVWSTENNKKYSLYSTIQDIIDAAPSAVWTECCFNPKLVFFHQVFPTTYQRLAERISAYDIYHCEGETKTSLVRAGGTNNLITGKKEVVYGKEVDTILFKAINEHLFDDCNFTNIEEIFGKLANDSANYNKNHGRTKNGEDKAPGICDVISSRGYISLLDFYYLHLKAETQIKYAKEFLVYRQAYKIAKDDLTEKAILSMLEQKKENGIER